MRAGRLGAVALASIVAAGGCGGHQQPSHATRPSSTQPPSGAPPALFQALPVGATVIPASGGVHTVFRVRISVRQPLGVVDGARHGYMVHVLKDPPAGPCIIETDGFLTAGNAVDHMDIVLDPAHTMGHQWCPGTFRGTLSYYQAYACPATGPCAVPAHFPRRAAAVGRISFHVNGRGP
jgi:hypothetical protein